MLLTADTCEATLSDINIRSRSIRLRFESSTDAKQNCKSNHNDTVPETIILDHLLSAKLTPSLTNHNSVTKKKLGENIDGDPIEKLRHVKSLSKPNSSALIQRFGRFFSQQTIKSNDVILSESTQVDLNYVDISESFVWTVKRLQLEMDFEAANHLCLILTRCLSKLKHRPRHLLAFVNPQCGKSRGRSVYTKKVLPLFEEANIKVNTIYTERPNHARDYINEQSLDDYDGLVCVGGDGMFAELCHGLLLKMAQQAKLDINDPKINLVRPNLRIGVIPAGSTDAVVFDTTGYNDPITSALQIIVGESLLIDITTVHSERGFVRFMATMLSYGFFGNIIQQSDSWRYFGPLRYNLAGFCQFIRNSSYHTELTIVQAPHECYPKALADNSNRNSFGNSVEQQNMFCSRNDEDFVGDQTIDSGKLPSLLQIKRENRYRTVNCLNTPCRCAKSKYGMSPSLHLGDGSFDVILVKHSRRTKFFRFLHRVADDGRTIDELPNVERYRATEVIIRPIVTRRKEPGNWACDGELFTSSEVIIRAHHQALNLFASGIRLDQIKEINEEKSKVIGCFSAVSSKNKSLS